MSGAPLSREEKSNAPLSNRRMRRSKPGSQFDRCDRNDKIARRVGFFIAIVSFRWACTYHGHCALPKSLHSTRNRCGNSQSFSKGVQSAPRHRIHEPALRFQYVARVLNAPLSSHPDLQPDQIFDTQDGHEVGKGVACARRFLFGVAIKAPLVLFNGISNRHFLSASETSNKGSQIPWIESRPPRGYVPP